MFPSPTKFFNNKTINSSISETNNTKIKQYKMNCVSFDQVLSFYYNE